MGVSAFMQAGEPIVVPGEKATRVVKIRNTGQVVDNVLVDIVGDAAEWTSVEPSSLNLFPGDEGQVTVTFAPPKSATVRAGMVPFAVRIVSSEDTAGSVVEEGEIEVAAFTELAAEVVPRTIRGKRRATTELAIDNVGNIPINVQLVLEDPETKVGGSIEPAALTLEPGKATFADVTVRPRKPFWRGASETLPFQIAVVSEGGQAPIYADGVMLQEQILPKWLLKALALLIALAIALFVLYQTIFKQALESAAQDAAAEEIAALEEQVEAAEEEAAAANEAAEAAQEQADAVTDAVEGAGVPVDEPGEAGGGDPPGGGGELGGGGGGNSIQDLLDRGTARSFRMESSVSGAAPPQTLPAIDQPADQIFLLTDVVFQNPNGDTGRIIVQRAGQTVLSIGLENFRDLDYHFVAPIQFDAGSALTMIVDCNNSPQTTFPGNCSTAATFSGVLVAPEEA